jgi:hypothetical protein
MTRSKVPSWKTYYTPTPETRKMQLGELSTAMNHLAAHEETLRAVRESIEARIYYLMAEGFTQAELAEACHMGRREVVDTACELARKNKWPWPPTLEDRRFTAITGGT